MDGGDGFFYGSPSDAPLVVKFNPLDKSLTEMETSGAVVCLPTPAASTVPLTDNADHILKINTFDGTVKTLDNVELPETGGDGELLWASGALASDNNIYYMPSNARRIMRLNPDNDSLSSVGDDLGEGSSKYNGTVVGNDNCVYGIPYHATRIVKFDPTNPDTTSTVGEEAEEFLSVGMVYWVVMVTSMLRMMNVKY